MPGRVISYEQVVATAERVFHGSGRLDMDELAVASSVSRATLYRVVGGRDRVLGDVLWHQGDRLLQRVLAATPGSGVERLVEVADRFHRELITYPALRTLLREDPVTAFRVLFMAEGRVHARFVERWRELLEEACEDGDLRLPMDPAEAAYVFVRVGESLVYSDLLGDRPPDLDLARRVQRALLHALQHAAPT